MTEVEIDGARQELERAVERLREQLGWLVARLTPGAALDLAGAGQLYIDDKWQPDGRYGELAGRVPRPVEEPAPDLAERAAQLLESAGWELAEPGDAGVNGHRDGFEVWVQVARTAVEYRGKTPVTRLYRWVSPEPKLTAELVRPGCVLCPECDGLGWCPLCEGRRVFPNQPLFYTGYRSGCPECHGDNACFVCRGEGQVPADR